MCISHTWVKPSSMPTDSLPLLSDQPTLSDPAQVATVTPKARKTDAGRIVDLLPKIVEAVRWGQKDRFNEAIELMAKEVELTRPSLAKKIRENGGLNEMKPLNHVHAGAQHVCLQDAVRSIDSIIMSPGLREQIHRFIDEASRREALKAYRLKPRHKIILSGASGNGKTLIAESIAHALKVPFLNVKYGSLVDSFLGGTGKNIDHVLEYAASGPCVLFFDEFDGVAVKRNEGRDVTEIRRVTNHLLIHLEKIPGWITLVAATNELDLIDSAIVRRFDTHWIVPPPSQELRLACIAAELNTADTGGRDLSTWFAALSEAPIPNLKLVVDVCTDIRRDLALNQGRAIASIISAVSAGIPLKESCTEA